MKEIIDKCSIEELQTYIEKKEGLKLKLRLTKNNFCRKSGHQPHYDYGYNNKGEPSYHMSWCKYSASYLKTKNFDGGEFIF